MEINENSITVVGCGPGSADYLMPVAIKAITQAQVLVGAPRLLGLFPKSHAKRIIVSGHIDHILDEIQHALEERTSVAVLVSGDPGIFSLARCVTNRFGVSRCRVIPAVSSVQTAFARIGLDWHDAKIMSAHHTLPEKQTLNCDTPTKIAILAGHKGIKPWLSELLSNQDEDTDIVVCENLTLENEMIQTITPSQVNQIEFSSRTIILVINQEARS